MRPTDPRTYSRQRIEETRRPQTTRMPPWLKQRREAYRDRLTALAEQSLEQTGVWFLARGASRENDEQETHAVWVDLMFFADLERLPGYSRENHQKAISFWQSWQNLQTGRLYNPLYQDPQHPETGRATPGNRAGYSPEAINAKYIPNILSALGAALLLPVPGIATLSRPGSGEDNFDDLWSAIAQRRTSSAGALPVDAARALDAGRLDKLPQVEAGMGALLRAYNRETGMWRPEPPGNFPWREYEPSSGFKILSRICGYVGMENFPEALQRTAVDNLLAHRGELYDHPAMARNYGETFAHYLMLGDYRREEQLDAMQGCLDGFRDPAAWESTDTGTYCLFGSGMIGAFMNWEDLPLERAMSEWERFAHGCDMKWRLVADPYGHWVNAVPKAPEEIPGHPEYDAATCGLKGRNRVHWARRITEAAPQQDVVLRLGPGGRSGTGTFTFTLSPDQLARGTGLYLKATWSGAYDVSLNGEPVKQVRYNLPDIPAGWHLPREAARTLRARENTIRVTLIGPGKDQTPAAPLSQSRPFIRLGLIDWR